MSYADGFFSGVGFMIFIDVIVVLAVAYARSPKQRGNL